MVLTWPYLSANTAASLSLERSRPENDEKQPKLFAISGFIWFSRLLYKIQMETSNSASDLDKKKKLK